MKSSSSAPALFPVTQLPLVRPGSGAGLRADVSAPRSAADVWRHPKGGLRPRAGSAARRKASPSRAWSGPGTAGTPSGQNDSERDASNLLGSIAQATENANCHSSGKLVIAGVPEREYNGSLPLLKQGARKSLQETGSLAATMALDNDVNDAIGSLTSDLEGLVSVVKTAKKQREDFDPSRRPAAAIEAPSAGAKKVMSPEEREAWLEKIEQWKMCRRIEPELPDLSLSEDYEKPPPPTQVSVNFNTTRQAVRFSVPVVRDARHATRGAERTAQQQLVRQQRLSRGKQLLELRKMDSQRMQLSSAHSSAVLEQEAELPEEKWFVVLALAMFAQSIQENLKLEKLSYSQYEEYMSKHTSTKKQPSRSHTNRLMVKRLDETVLQNPHAADRLNMLATMFKTKVRIGQSRAHAQTIFTCLNHWSIAGRCHVSVKRFGQIVRKLQRWWRSCRRAIHKARDKLSRRWKIMEHKMIAHDILEEDLLKTPAERALPQLALSEKIELRSLSDVRRIDFIEHELRARRYFLIPQVTLWQQESKKWHAQMAEWRKTLEAHVALGVALTKNPPFAFPPVRPSYMPVENEEKGDAEVQNMITRARARKGLSGWLEIPKTTGSVSASLRRSRRRSQIDPNDDEEKPPFGEASAEVLETLGVNINGLLSLPGLEPHHEENEKGK
eukprot:gnl/TRDRNA2_/TRDRNA2_85328_c0_seq1.p1 gnl/TRDRNA2_/TRDRNA2_85328_c0~~gnl/TRDRNA2_/TRDRNA2_85328_c0_seq1.p1  ORF type:complete len:670 (+),score=101.19 gnl/TRDRNA2_/TRDRNA2_85328_c0_seq1:95-2104(+)